LNTRGKGFLEGAEGKCSGISEKKIFECRQRAGWRQGPGAAGAFMLAGGLLPDLNAQLTMKLLEVVGTVL
jgi:hypothetical protein